mmetsp:Transcript_20478/g.66507  ORF Transcript_20478/g.66507 Transcript_20478/m.66507 type:complete len:183 (-) Transcript_20478:88-636(-)|eukprot:CAMPEP_0170144140 /NCGR_PEP_ID=MMETSP0033_2-20121228/13322_1 /TAXON_ID=195969 /ORGANISM="Dolichomastix tenuilepis, Strain CCMP3274" /LENGTH=182 /DNA_ID=CAMNT_0010380623 /DNA_START=13 /DNA_END=561 /DNA_ORIENTATION=+
MSMLLTGVGLTAAACYCESALVPAVAASTPLAFLFEGAKGLPVSRAFGLVPLSLFHQAFTLIGLGSAVGRARKKFDVPLPKMQAEGESEEAKKFNNVQRGHQQALETYTTVALCTVIAGIKFPLTSTLASVIWCIGRKAWAKAYAEGGPEGRYAGLGKLIWTGLLMEAFAAVATGFMILAGK